LPQGWEVDGPGARTAPGSVGWRNNALPTVLAETQVPQPSLVFSSSAAQLALAPTTNVPPRLRTVETITEALWFRQEGDVTARKQLWDVAFNRPGHVTLLDAAELDIDGNTVRMLVAKGSLTGWPTVSIDSLNGW
jgi:hypothetical protein